jgi:type IV fimbrial biogenesis protein FimT
MKQSGITLTELLVTLAVMAVLLTQAVPGLAALIASNQLTGLSNEFLASLHLARSEAIKRGQRTVLCASSDGKTCAGGGGWHQGWLVFHDANNNAARDNGEALILSRLALPANIRLTGNQFVSNYISYAPNGGTKLVSGAWQAGTLTLCKTTGTPGQARQLVISSTGRVRTLKVDLGNCP